MSNAMQRIMRHSSSLGRYVASGGPLWQKKFPDGLRLKLASILLLLGLKRQLYSRGLCRLLRSLLLNSQIHISNT